MKKHLQIILVAFLACAATANANAQNESNKHNHGKRTSELVIEHELITKFNDKKSYLIIRDFCVFGMQFISVIPIRQREGPIAMDTTQVIGSDGKPMHCRLNPQSTSLAEPNPN